MLQLFRKNYFVNILFLIPYAIILHLGSWLKRVDLQSCEHDWLYNQLINYLHINYEAQVILSLLLILVEAFLLNRICNKFRMNQDGQLFAGLFFILLSGFHAQTIVLSPVLLANLFFILAINYVFDIYQKKNSPIQLFNFGFLIGLASIIYLPYYFLFLFGLIGLIILKGFNLRELLQMLIGFINPYFLILIFFYIKNLLPDFYHEQVGGYFRAYLFAFQFQQKGWIMFSVLFLIMIYSISQYNYFQVKRSILVQKYYDLVFWACLLSLGTILFLNVQLIAHQYIWITPLAILFGGLMPKFKNPLISETIHLLLFVSALFLQFQNW